MLITDLKNRVVVGSGMGKVVKYWVRGITNKDGMLIFDVTYAESCCDGTTWQHAPDASIQLSDDLTSFRPNPLEKHPETEASFPEYSINCRYVEELLVMEEGVCMSSAVLLGSDRK